MSAISTIGTALSGLLAYQQAQEVVGHNVANANTTGYRRQEAVFETAVPYPAVGSSMSPTGGMLGVGVEVNRIRQIQDVFSQQQLTSLQGQLGRWEMTQDGLKQIESFLSPGQGLDLSSMLDRFFGAWQNLATRPEDLVSRQTVRSEAINLTTSLNQNVAKLDTLSFDIGRRLQAQVDRLNLLADNLADLNVQIGMAVTEGREPNDLRDQRELILGEMSHIAGVTSLSAQGEGTSITNLGGHPLVEGSVVHHLSLEPDANGVLMVTWSDEGTTAQVPGGEIAGYYDLRDNIIPAYRSELDTIASALAQAVNTLHGTGVTMDDQPAGDFFTGTTAGAIHVSDDILADARNISATRLAGASGDGSLANEIFRLNSTALIGNQTVNQYAQGLIGQIGNAVKSADTNVSATKALQAQIYTRQQSISGVSLDEEMANLLVFQRAYDACARVLSTQDDMLRTLIERTGS